MSHWNDWMDEELDRLEAHAEVLKLDFYAAMSKNGEFANYAPRIRRRTRTLTIEWRIIRYIKGKPLHETMARGQGHRYGMGRFTRAHEWEEKAIDEFETSAEFIRRQCDALNKIALVAIAYDKRAEAFQSRTAGTAEASCP